MQKEKLIIVGGMSGAGKTSFLNSLEDLGYQTLNNITCHIAQVILDDYQKDSKDYRIAIGLDISEPEDVAEYDDLLKYITTNVKDYEIIFLDARDEVLIKRYTFTRRKHPVASNSILSSIEKERVLTYNLKASATQVVDTSQMDNKKFAEFVKKLVMEKGEQLKEITIHLESFGFKYGAPIDLDLIFDLRCLRNPYYIPELKVLTGNDKEVRDYVMSDEVSQEFYKRIVDMLKFLIPNYIKEGKKHLSVGLGCSGGQHRSVTFVNLLEEELSKMNNIRVSKTNIEETRGHWSNDTKH